MVQRLGVMIGSPGDAASERDAVTTAILKWNAHSGRTQDIILEPVRWETHVTPGLRGRPQGMINDELIPHSDILIAFFRSRAGSPTGVDVSGTFEEIRAFMAQGKHVVVYFYEGDVSIDSIDTEQLKTLREFKKELREQGITDSYKTVDDLSAKLPHHLSAMVSLLLTERSDGTFLSSLFDATIPVLIFGEELEQRQTSPWIDSALGCFQSSADSLREIALTDTAIEEVLDAELNSISDLLDSATSLTRHHGWWSQLSPLVQQAVQKIKVLASDHTDDLPHTQESVMAMRQQLEKAHRQLTDLSSRAETLMDQGRREYVQETSSDIGLSILWVAYHNTDCIHLGSGPALREIGHDLHLIETMPIRLDGGRSQMAILERLRKATESYDLLIGELTA